MNNFNYWAPTKVIFGKDAELEAGKEIASRGGHKVLVISAIPFFRKTGFWIGYIRALRMPGWNMWTWMALYPIQDLALSGKALSCAKKKILTFYCRSAAEALRIPQKRLPMALQISCHIFENKSRYQNTFRYIS